MGTGDEMSRGGAERNRPVSVRCQGSHEGAHCGRVPDGAFVFIGLDPLKLPTVAVVPSCYGHRDAVSVRARTFAISDGMWADADEVVQAVDELTWFLIESGDPYQPEIMHLVA